MTFTSALAPTAARRCRLTLAAGLMACLSCLASNQAEETLLDESFADGNREAPEADVYVGSPDDVSVSAANGLTYAQSTSSRKLHAYFTDSGEFASLTTDPESDKLTLSVDFVPLGTVANLPEENGSRSFRFGLFRDPDGGRVAMDTNDGGGGDGDPWTNAQGYGVQMLMHTDPAGSLFRIGKRVNENSNIQGSSGAFDFPSSGGDMVSFVANTLYTFQLELMKMDASNTQVTASLLDESGALLSTHNILDDGSLGGDIADSVAPYDLFNFFHGRFSNAEETSSALQFRNFTVVGHAVRIPEPGSSALAALALVPLALWHRKR